MARLMNMDRNVCPNPVTIIAETDLERGQLLAITGMAKNNIWLNNEDDFEAYKVVLASADTKMGDLLVHTSVPNQFDERLDEADFVLVAGKPGRGHYIKSGDEYTLAKNLVVGTLAVGSEVILSDNGKLELFVAGNGSTTEDNGVAIGEVVKLYTFNGQDSVMVRFY